MKKNDFWKKPLAGFDFWKDTGGAKFYPALANWAIDFFSLELCLTTAEWSGRPFDLQDWQKQLVGHLFGWIKEDGTRRFRKLFLYIPRKNGKTELAAGLGVIFFVADGEPSGEVYCGALTIPQANIFFKKVKKMVKSNSYLSERIKPPRGRTNRILYDEQTESQLMVLAADGDAAQGFNTHCAVVDELHTLKNGEFVGALQESMGARRQPMTIEITTAADAGDNFCNNELDYAIKVRDGIISDPSVMPILFMADVNDDPGDPNTWRKCNPSVGVTVPLSYYQSQYNQLSKTASGLIRFKKYFLNLQTSKVENWIDLQYWENCKTNMTLDQLKGKECYLTVDRSSVNDISSFGMFFPEFNAYHALFIVPKETAEENMAYLQWSKYGYIETSEFRAIDDDEIFEMIERIMADYDVIAMGYDPWRMTKTAQNVAKTKEDGGLGLKCVAIAQSYKELTEPINNVEILIRNGELKHFDNPVLKWMFTNCRVEKDHKENVKIVKDNPKSPRKIDGIITLIMSYKLSKIEDNEIKHFTEGVSWV